MEMAGHVPLCRVSIEKDDRELEKYVNKSEDELRAALLDEIVEGKAPDGTVLQ